ncbi:MAG: alcohol dehydrogenase catalytic domain-containing protein [Gemmatimonadota bacterium]|jgi:threonine dehydrogenase-like Zn-dependent dehydrogenase
MRAVTFDVSVPRYLAAKSLGRVTSSVLYGRLSGVRMREVELPDLPGPRWARLEVLKAGICGTDVGTITYSASPVMEPFGSFPAVLGHEILARVVEVGPGVEAVEPGQRVVVDPMVSCGVRGRSSPDWCPSCAAGRHCTCEAAGEQGPLEVGGRPVAAGLTMGFHRSLPGGWGEQMLAHETQLFTVPDELGDHTAALVEPLAVGAHAALGVSPVRDEPVLVIGSGPIALGAVWALRASGFPGELVAQTKREHEAKLALRLGASGVVRPGEEAREAMVGTGASAYMPLVGDEVWAGGGFPLIVDCVGSRSSLEQALRFASPRGRIVMLGCAAEIRKLDLTFVWARELRIEGFVGYGSETFRGRTAHTFEVVLDLLRETDAPVEKMVTHVYPLDQYREAVAAAASRASTGSVKVLLDPT